MKILIYGAGVVGCTYGWLLSEAGHEVAVLVRRGQADLVRKKGIRMDCLDFRGGGKKHTDAIFRPAVIEELLPDNDFEYILVSTNKMQLPDVLPVLKASAGNANIVFFQNSWDCMDEIVGFLATGQYFFGFPFMAGGGRDAEGIHCVISGMKYSHTPLGEANGETTPRVLRLAGALDEANLKPVVSTQILLWIITHYAVAAGLTAGILSAGGAGRFIKDSTAIRTAILAIREGFAICRKRGYDPKKEKANRLYRLPLFFSVPVARKVYSNEALQLMFDGHIGHSPEEVRQMVKDMIRSGVEYGVETPNFIALNERIDLESR